MKEYIERDAAIELGKKQSCAGIIDGGDFCNISANMLRKIPAADVVEVRHGEWHRLEACDKWQCSECGVLMGIEGTPNENLLHYCPYCGAKMDGGADE